ncbi:MAG: cysteine desulfurase [Opitutales bacterium]|nr:cysteine desulfurase [Opitutales bacterium]
MVYFDHNATAPMLPQAEAAFVAAAREHFANPSSPHRAGARARAELDRCRERVAGRLGAEPEEIVFTSGATEGANAVLRHFAGAAGGAACLISAVEHPCVRAAADAFWKERVHSLEVDDAGRVEMDRFGARLRDVRPALVAVMAANNETGVLQPWEEIAGVCRSSDAVYLCDAVQWAGRLPLRVPAGRTFLVGSGHKFGGPKGVGFLRVPRGVEGFAAMVGGEQEGGRRAGTENLPGVAAMTAALEHTASLADDTTEAAARRAWRRDFVERLAPSGVKAATGEAKALWNTVSLVMPHALNHRWVNRLSRRGFMVSTGSACATGREGPSHVLSAMGLAAGEARRTIRVSSGWETKERDWQALADAVGEIAGELRSEGSSAVVEIPD